MECTHVLRRLGKKSYQGSLANSLRGPVIRVDSFQAFGILFMSLNKALFWEWIVDDAELVGVPVI